HLMPRIPNTNNVLIQPRDSSRAGLTADEILIVDLDGRLLEGKGPPPSETAIHLGVYRAREDALAVGDGHPSLSVLFSMVDAPMIAMRNFGFRFIGCPVPSGPHPHPHARARRRSGGDA